MIALQEDAYLAKFMALNGITWKFSATLAPWWGGFWGRMVRTRKEISHKVLGAGSIDISALTAHMAEVEAIINNRPLTYAK